MDWWSILAWGVSFVGLIMILTEMRQILNQCHPFFVLDVGEWIEPKVEIAVTVLTVLFSILVQGWIIFLFIGSLSLSVGALVFLWGFGMPAPACLTALVVGLVLAIGIPFREKYLVGQDSSMESFFLEFQDLFFRGRDEQIV